MKDALGEGTAPLGLVIAERSEGAGRCGRRCGEGGVKGRHKESKVLGMECGVVEQDGKGWVKRCPAVVIVSCCLPAPPPPAQP